MSVMATTAPHCALLPKPFPTHTYAVGDLLTDPRTPTASSLLRTSALSDRDYDDTRLTAWYKDVAALSAASGNFTRSLGGEMLIRKPRRRSSATQRFCSIEAEKATVRALKAPLAAFEKSVRAPAARDWLLKAVRARKPVYWVAAVQELTNANYAHAAAKEVGGGMLEIAREPAEPVDPEADEEADVDGDAMRAKHASKGGHRRRDSAFEEPTYTKTDVLAAEIREVRVKLTRPDVPHSTRDMDFHWTYLKVQNDLGEDVQLAVGLGAPLDQEEVADLWEEGDLEEDEWEDDDE